MLTPLVLSCFLILKRVQVLQTYRIYIIDHIFYASEANHQFEHDIYVTSIYFELLMGLVERASWIYFGDRWMRRKGRVVWQSQLSLSCAIFVKYLYNTDLCNNCAIFVHCLHNICTIFWWQMKGRAVWQSKLFRPCNVLFCAVFVKYFGKCFNVYFGKCFNVYLGKYFKVLYYLGESQGGGSCMRRRAHNCYNF